MTDQNKNVETVKVMVRCRPRSSKQKQQNRKVIVQVDQKLGQIIVKKPNDPSDVKTFSFDSTFGTQSEQKSVYQQTGFQLVQNVLEGYNGTIFAYGQTGCGKTFIMMGVQQDQQLRGVIPRTFSQIVTMVQNADQNKKYLVRCSFLEIYNEQIHDLLSDSKSNLQLKQSPDKGVFIKDLSMNAVKSVKDMQKWMNIGYKNRAVRATEMNANSSRSHSIFTIYIDSQQCLDNGKSLFKSGKLNLVDLAGSQRQSKTHASGDGLKQAAKINLSLSALGNVISALVDGKTNHIPYRDSKLTRLLQDSLGGNTKTIMIAALSPVDYNYEQTISTLRYASRAKFIKNKPRINEDPKDTAIRQYAQQIEKLKMMLQGRIPFGNNINHSPLQMSSNSSNLKDALVEHQRMIQAQKQQRQKLKEKLQSLQQIFAKPKPQKQSKQEKQKLMKLKQQLKQQKRKKQEYRKQKELHQQIRLNKQKDFQDMSTQIDAMRKQFKQLRNKNRQVQQQIQDITEQQEVQREDLLETIRFQEKQLNKLTSIMQMLLTKNQIQKIQRMCFKDEQTGEYDVPAFYLKQKIHSLPKLRDLEEIEERKQTLTSQSLRLIQSPPVHYRSFSTSKKVQLNPIAMQYKNDKKDFNPFNMNYTGHITSDKRKPTRLDPLIPMIPIDKKKKH